MSKLDELGLEREIVFVCFRLFRDEVRKLREESNKNPHSLMDVPTKRLISIGDKTYELKEHIDDHETIVD
jgi:hypothetical protein